jgi:hypothetical protein
MSKLEKVKKLAKKYGAEEVKLSTRKNKKFMVKYKNKWVHFGQKGYEDFLDHKDPKRRKNYRTRAKGIRDGQNRLTYKLKTSPNFWAVNVLW